MISSRIGPRGLVAAIAFLTAVPAVAGAQESALVQSSGKWSATLVFSGRMAGDLRVEKGKKDDESQARLDIRNAPINRQIAWDIAEGVCGDNAQSIAPRAKFRQMLTSNDGNANVRVAVPRLQPGKRYYVRVFDPGFQGEDRGGMSCVNLSEEP